LNMFDTLLSPNFLIEFKKIAQHKYCRWWTGW
jgi:hypothetical protein